MKKIVMYLLWAWCQFGMALAYAQDSGSGSEGGSGKGIGSVAANVRGNLGDIAKLITAASYVAGFAFVVGAIVKFKAHKDNPNQIPIGTPIALLFVGAALIFVPSVFSTAGSTLFVSGVQGGVSGVASF